MVKHTSELEELAARTYRKLYPRNFPCSPYERQRELRDLWPVEQDKFKRIVDAARGDTNA